MAKLTDPDQLTDGVEVNILPATKTVQCLVAGNLTNTSPGATSGVTLQALYSFLKDRWHADPALNKFTFPLKAFTKNEFQWINEWEPHDATTRTLIRDAGWEETKTGATNGDLYAGMITLGNFNAVGDQGYYQQVTGFGESTTDFDKTGDVNEAILINDASGFNYTDFFKAFLREQGKTYATYDLLVEQDLSVLEATLYRFPLENDTDLNIVASDALIELQETVTFQNAGNTVTGTTAYVDGNKIRFDDTSGTLPTGVSPSVTYYVVNEASPLFQISLTLGGAAVTFPDDGAATVTADSWPYLNTTLDYLTATDHAAGDDWTISTLYAVGDLVKDGEAPSRWFRCTVGGTSDGDATDLAGGSDTICSWEVDPGERLIGSVYYHFSRIVDGIGGSRYETYEWMQLQLRQTSDINDDINGDTFGTVNGNIADELANFRGSDLVLEEGVFIDNLPLADLNNVIFQPHDFAAADLGEVSFPFVAVLTFNFSPNMVAALDADTLITNYFTNNDAGDDDGSDFDTAAAIIVQDNSDVDMSFEVDAASIAKDYDYDNNVQRGAGSAATDAPCTLQVVGLADYENTTVVFTIERANATINVNATDERNYAT